MFVTFVTVLCCIRNTVLLCFRVFYSTVLYYSFKMLKPGFHISQFSGDLLSGIAEGENDFRNTNDFIHC